MGPATTSRIHRCLGATAIVLAGVLAGACDGSSERAGRPLPSDAIVVVMPQGEKGGDLARVRIADGEAEMLTQTPERPKSSLSWLPTLQRVLYTETRVENDSPNTRMMLLDPLSGSVRMATDALEARELQPSPSPTGEWIAYVFAGPTPTGQARGISIARPMSAQTSLFRTPPSTDAYLNPQMSPVGRIVVAERAGPGRGSDLWLLRNQQDDVELVAERRYSDTGPAFSRSGSVVYFERSYARVRRGNDDLGGGDVCRVHVETLQVDCIATSSDAREFGIQTSPATDEIAFLREGSSGIEVVIADEFGKEPRVVYRSSGEKLRALRWSPDGQRLVFEAGPPRSAASRVIDRSGAVLLETPGGSPAFAPFL